MEGSDIYKWNPPMNWEMIREECLNIRGHEIPKNVELESLSCRSCHRCEFGFKKCPNKECEHLSLPQGPSKWMTPFGLPCHHKKSSHPTGPDAVTTIRIITPRRHWHILSQRLGVWKRCFFLGGKMGGGNKTGVTYRSPELLDGS